MQASFKKSGMTIFSRGPRGTIRLVDDGLQLTYEDGSTDAIRFADLKKVGFNSNNGLWTFYPKEGKKQHLQTTGALFSIGDRTQGQQFNEALGLALARHGVKGFAV